jgi:hypothetical protein
MKLLCWLFGHSWRIDRLDEWGLTFNEAYYCKRCGKVEEE